MTETPDQIANARANLLKLFKYMREHKASDLFLSAGLPPSVKLDGKLTRLTQVPLTGEQVGVFGRSQMSAKQQDEFERTNECNFAVAPQELGRFRVNAYVQQAQPALVFRAINETPPDLDEMGLPPILKEIIMQKRGLVVMIGATGSGKSTTLAGMLDYRNINSQGHILTVEDPIEFVHPHKGCVVSQREVGTDTADWWPALKNALRQAPDVILMGEIRDKETMEHALAFADTGHLCVATLHANSANQGLSRILNFFSEERREQLLLDMSANVRAFVSQRLIPKQGGAGRVAAVEIMLNTPMIAGLISDGKLDSIKETMQRSREAGMQTFDQALFDLFEAQKVSYEDAIRNADSANELRLEIKLRSERFRKEGGSSELDTGNLSLD